MTLDDVDMFRAVKKIRVCTLGLVGALVALVTSLTTLGTCLPSSAGVLPWPVFGICSSGEDWEYIWRLEL